MKLILKASLVCSAFLLTPPVSLANEVTFYAQQGNWVIQKGDSDCSLAGFFGNYLSVITVSEVSDSAIVSVSNAAWKSLNAGEKQKIDLYFIRNNRLDDGWGEVTGIATSSDSTFSKSLVFKLDRDPFLTDISRSETLGFMRKGIAIAAFDLRGTATMVQRLRQCTAEVERENPGDPFAH